MSAPALNRTSRARVRAGAREADRSRGSWETITGALEQTVGPGRPSGAWTRYCCPAHEGDGGHHRPSLGVKYDSGQQRTVVRCFAGCDNEVVLDKLGLAVRDMFDRRPDRTGRDYTPRPRPRQLSRADRAIDAAGLPLVKPKKDLGRQVSAWQQVAAYPYAREDGTVAGEVVREEAKFAGGRDKRFRQRAWRPGTGWADTGFEPLPFQLPCVLDAIGDGRTVYVCEGEKDVLAAQAANLVATTNAGGALAWKPEHAAWLRGAATVVIVADKDAPGYRRAEKVMGSLAGLVGRVRVVQAATGKDLFDHLQAGHEIGELEPIPHLDPFTPTGPAVTAAPVPEIPAAETDVVSAVSSSPQEGPSMSSSLMFEPTAHHPQHDDTVDHVNAAWAGVMRMLMQYLIAAARKHREASRANAERKAAQDADEKAQAEAELAAQRAAAEARIQKVREGGLENASRAEIAQVVADAAAWAPDSEAARKALVELKAHVAQRYGIEIDAITGEVVPEGEVSPELAVSLQAAEVERASQDRIRKAQERMVEMVAREELDQSVKEELYAEIEAWRANPTATGLGALSKKMADKGVGEQTVTRIRFVAAYLATPGQQVTDEELGAVSAATPTTELRKLGAALVDPGEEAKPGIDRLFASYQDRLKVGNRNLTASIRAQLNEALKVLTPEDQAKARARGNEIRKNPAATYAPLWPDHVDRDELAAVVRMYATLAPQADAAAVRANNIDDATAAAMRKQAAKHRKTITHAITDGKGLHQLEKDQLTAVLRDVEAGKATTPEMLFADDRSAAALDAERAGRIARGATRAHRQHVEKLLDTNAVPRAATRRTRDDLTRVMDTQSDLAAGRASLSDYERTGVAGRFTTALQAAGVSEPMRRRVAAHLDLAAGEATSLGKQAQRIAERWEQRREAVEAERAPEKPAYDSPERRAEFAATLEAAGLDPDQVAQRMAADAGRAKPASAAVRRIPDKARKNAPGAGVQHTHHRGKGRGLDDNDLGR
ncbi:toprim domain-containing protein [Nocardia sp. NPDC023852]|uniref:toprim domain-containing protein n=1 Tax=Nocardia sp. NPDC023852 TaxID=3154697 RepID=UPI0033C5CEF3